jgi:hypothetical protein
MRSKHAFGMLDSLRRSYTLRRVTSATFTAVIASVTVVVSCAESFEVPASALSSPDADGAAPENDASPTTLDGSAGEGAAVLDGEGVEVEAGGFPLCLRLSDPNRPVKVLDLSADVRTGYLTLVARDCTLEGLLPARSATLATWSNQLYEWNLDLWGCTDHPATGFALVHAEVAELTSSDEALLIDDYLLATSRVLRLSASEAARLRRDVTRLAAATVVRTSDDHPFATCDAGDGGDALADSGDEAEVGE